MTALVTLTHDQATTTTLAIADGIGNKHEAVIKLVRTYTSDLEEFGPLRFEIRVGRADGKGGQKTEIARLNERQATLLMTYMRNGPVARAFKKALVKAFYDIAQQLEARAIPAPQPGDDDIDSKRARWANHRDSYVMQCLLAATREYPGSTCVELGFICGVPQNLTANHVATLADAGLIRPAGSRRCEVIGRSVVTWRAANAGAIAAPRTPSPLELAVQRIGQRIAS